MKKYVQCKVCSFIGTEGEMKNVCPACGAPGTAFESYEYKISEKRQKQLALHIHPILVHFPQSLAFISFVFIVIAFTIQNKMSGDLLTSVKILSSLLPFTVLIAIAAGFMDAKTRFKNKFGPLIKQKILFGAIFTASSIMTAVLMNQEVFTVLGKTIVILLSIVSLFCSALLGKKGGVLLDAKRLN